MTEIEIKDFNDTTWADKAGRIYLEYIVNNEEPLPFSDILAIMVYIQRNAVDLEDLHTELLDCTAAIDFDALKRIYEDGDNTARKSYANLLNQIIIKHKEAVKKHLFDRSRNKLADAIQHLAKVMEYVGQDDEDVLQPELIRSCLHLIEKTLPKQSTETN